MVNPGAFRGLRKEFLLSEKEKYAAGMEGGYGADALAQIQRRYFKRFPVDLPHFEEPSPEHLAAVNDDVPDPEPEEPDPEKLSPEEYELARKACEHRREVVRYRKAQIKRWLAYQYMKDQDLDPKESGANNPFHSLIFSITGKEAGRPRRKTAVNVWRKSQRHEIEAKVKGIAGRDNVEKDRLAALRDQIARDMFNKLPSDEQSHWQQQAKIESDFALEQWKRAMLSDPPSTAKDYQTAIQGLVRVAKPFLDFVCKATGWKASLIAGGPEPAQGGKLNVISIHAGTTPGEMKLNWGRALRTRFKRDVVTCFGDFLKMCYTPDMCRSRALAVGEGFGGLVEEECDGEGVDLDSVDPQDAGAVTVIGSSTSTSTSSSSTPPVASTASRIARAAASTLPPPSAARALPNVARAVAPASATTFRPPSTTARAAPASSSTRSGANTARPPDVARAAQSGLSSMHLNTSRTPFPFGPGRQAAPYQRIPPVRAPASQNTLIPQPSLIPAPAVPRAAVLSPSRRFNMGTLSPRTTPARSPVPSPRQPYSAMHSPEPVPHRFGLPDLLTPREPPAVQQRSPTPVPSPRPASPLVETPRNDGPADDALFWFNPMQSSGLPDALASPASRTVQHHEKSNLSSLGNIAQSVEPIEPQGKDGGACEQQGHGAKLPGAGHPKSKSRRKKNSENYRPPEPMRRSSRLTGEKRTEPSSAHSDTHQPKKKRKFSGNNKYGNWIESDSDGEGWHDQDGNPCDPPTPYRRK